ncbi:VanZ family protein [Haloarcula sp. JP-L23]|uniref:VanZ family protein n=1 Tax=Haloarcula sp. JP-L23 TaxID=2716717 RepID=UPI00140F22D8|nr:teicoplanin resistance protein VanZ [Haloarcula sp. JP-L23]
MRSRYADSRWTLVVVSTLVLCLAAFVPSPIERRPEWERIGPDKFLHLVGHGAYAVVVADAVAAGRWSDREAAMLAVCVSTLLSLVSGQLQNYVPGRAFELADVVAGLFGSLLAISGWYAVNGTSSVVDD